MTSFMQSKGTDSALDFLATSGGELSMDDLIEMLAICQIATCHERGERYVRQLGHYVEQGGVLRISQVDGEHVVDDLAKLRNLILRRDGALDIANNPSLRPARE